MKTLKKRISALLLAALMGLLFTVPVFADWGNPAIWRSGQHLFVVGCEESITLRLSPSTSALSLTQIPYMNSVTYLGPASNGFSYVEYRGQRGYVLSQYLDWEEPQLGDLGIYTYMYVVNCQSSITLRTMPSTKAAEICQIPLGSTVYVQSYARTNTNFYKVQYNGYTGYVLRNYLSR